MSISNSSNKIKQVIKASQLFFLRFPLRINFFILTAGLIFSYMAIHDNYSDEASLFTALLFVLLKLLLITVGLLIITCFITSIIPFLIYYFQKNEQIIQYQFQYNENDKVVFKINSDHIIRPIFGALQIMLVYDNGFYTIKQEMWNNNKSFSFVKRSGATGEYCLELPEIKNYQLKSIILFFEDTFNLFSFSQRKNINGQFITLPQQTNISMPNVQPTDAKDMVVRTDSPRRQQGEWLHFKSFESSDDVRRIVWSVYARNKELVVRIPEMQNMYASQVSFYASFYNMLTREIAGNHLNAIFSNHYKNCIWSFFSNLANNKEIELKYVPDQIVAHTSSPEINEVMYEITASEWQSDNPVSTFFNAANTSVLCISSLTPSEDLLKIAESAKSSTLILFVNLSKVFQMQGAGDIITQIFIKPNENEGRINKWKWLRSPLRPIILNNEQKIKEIFAKSSASFYEM